MSTPLDTPPRRRRVSLVAAVVLAVLAAGWLLTRYLSTPRHLVVVPAALSPFALVPALVGVALAVRSRSRLALAGTVVVVLSVLASQAPAFVAAGHGDGQSFVIITLNMRYGHADPAEVLRLAAAQHADAVALQELTPEAVDALHAAGLDTAYPYNVARPLETAEGTGLWSAHPLTDVTVRAWWLPMYVAARVDLGAGKPAPLVVSTHIPAPWPESSPTWAYRLSQLGAIMSAETGPEIVAGDFNSTLDQAPFRQLLTDTHASDAGSAAGSGWLRTFPANRPYPPIIAIDHVLLRGVSAVDAHTVTMKGSDHRSVVARLSIP